MGKTLINSVGVIKNLEKAWNFDWENEWQLCMYLNCTWIVLEKRPPILKKKECGQPALLMLYFVNL